MGQRADQELEEIARMICQICPGSVRSHTSTRSSASLVTTRLSAGAATTHTEAIFSETDNVFHDSGSAPAEEARTCFLRGH